MLFKLLVWLGKKFNIKGAPLCRVLNDANTERYTLYNDGWILIKAINGGAEDCIHISMASQKLIDKFEAELEK